MDRDYSGWGLAGASAPIRLAQSPFFSTGEHERQDLAPLTTATMANGMIPAGYLYKRIVPRPAWLDGSPHIMDVRSISACMSPSYPEQFDHWRHNGCWLYDEPSIMHEIAHKDGVSLDGMTLFYYEMYPQKYSEATHSWSPIELSHRPMQVAIPPRRSLQGIDVNCASQRNAPECSPLWCNGLCAELPVNEHCLFGSLDEARSALEQGKFDNSEPGPFRIYAVYSVD